MLNNINWKVRIQHLGFWTGLLGVIGSNISTYLGAVEADYTTWAGLFEVLARAFSNPSLLLSLFLAILGSLGVVTDHTTAGIGDSTQALGYETPRPKE
jgi:phi LC3 family holin